MGGCAQIKALLEFDLAHKKTRKHLQMDILSILNGYVEELDRNDPHWLRHLSTKEFQALDEDLAPFVPPGWQRNRNQT